MGNYTLFYPNRLDGATLSGGSWIAQAPITKTQDERLKVLAVSTDLTPASTQFDITLDQNRSIGVLALVNHNMTTNATWRVRAYYDAGFTTVVYDSGIVDVYPAFASSLELEWEDNNFWSGKPLEENIEGLTQTAIDVFGGQDVSAQYWRVELFDSSNAAGFISLGRVFIGQDRLNQLLNVQVGAVSGLISRTRVFETPGGHKEFAVREPVRTDTFTYPLIETQAAYSQFLSLEQQADVRSEVFLTQDADDNQNLLLRSYLGRLSALNGLPNTTYNTYQKVFQVEEKK